MIFVKLISDDTFEVTVQEGATTTHQVKVRDDYCKKLGLKNVTKEQLIKKSFEFLLERESNAMILSQFDLPVIQTYFSNYERDIKERFA